MGFEITDEDEKVEVIDALDSDATDAALSANQGKILNNSIAAVRTDYGNHEVDIAAFFESQLV